jgi:hypothetical protein
MPSPGYEPAIPASKWPQTYALDRAATEIGYQEILEIISEIWPWGPGKDTMPRWTDWLTVSGKGTSTLTSASKG